MADRAEPVAATSPLVDRIAALRRRYNHCFGCGLDNPIGLHLDGFTLDSEGLSASFVPRPEYAGFAGVLHGGILVAVLDEAMAWTAMLTADTYVVTANLETKFRKPAPTGGVYTVRGRVVEQRGRRIRLAATITYGDTTIADAFGLFIATEPATP